MNELRLQQSGLTVLSVTVVLCIALLVLLQGGFFGLATCAIGIVACMVAAVVWLRKPCRSKSLPVVPLLFVGLFLAYFISAVANGASLTTLSEAGVWAACAGIALITAAQVEEDNAWALSALAWFGIATSAAGMLTYAGWLPVAGGMVGDRLQFTFQYANAAAAWYAACVWLCLFAPNERLRTLAFFPAADLLLTQSGGGTVAFALVAAVIGVALARKDAWDKLRDILIQGVVCVVLFGILHLVPALGVLAAIVCAIAWSRANEEIAGRIAVFDARKVSLAIVGAFVAALVLGVVLLPGRAQDATASFVERVYQMRDGIALWSMSPVLGIGPDNWQYLYPWIQTAPYAVTVVHSSITQLLLDAGLVGFGLFCVAVVLGMRSLWHDMREPNGNPWSKAQLCAGAFLLLHSTMEFTLQFASLVCLMAVLLCGPTSLRIPTNAATTTPVAKGVVAGVLCLVLCLPGCIVGLLCSAVTTAMDLACQQQRYDACIQLYEQMPLARIDVTAQEKYIQANFECGYYDEVTRVYEQIPAPTNASVLYAAIAYNVGGNTAKAAEVLAARLEATPYSVELLEGAKRFAERFGIDASQKGRFDAAVEASEKLIASSEVVPA